MFSYKCKIKTPDGDKLYKGDLPFLPKVGEVIHFNNTYRVVDIVYHFFSMHDNKIGVTIIVEKETQYGKRNHQRSQHPDQEERVL